MNSIQEKSDLKDQLFKSWGIACTLFGVHFARYFYWTIFSLTVYNELTGVL